MEKQLFNPMEIDALGEIFNISLGSSATAVANLLAHKVDITTPRVSIVDVKDFSIGNLEPAMGIEIKYVEGLEGSNIMLLRRSDIKVIVDILMGAEMPEEEFELNELTVSAVCEVMNQMMGSASTALADFLGYPVNISTPVPFELDDMDEFKQAHLPKGDDTVVVVRFSFKIEDALETEFMNVMGVGLAKELLAGLGLGGGAAHEQPAAQPAAPAPAAPAPAAPAPAAPESSSDGGKLSQEEIERLLGGMGAAPAAPAPAAVAENVSAPVQPPVANYAPQPQQPAMDPAAQYAYGAGATMAPQGMAPQGMPAQGMPPQGMPYMPMYYPYPQQPQIIRGDAHLTDSHPASFPELDISNRIGTEQADNLDLIMEVPLQVTVEIGRTRRKVQDILEFSKGSLVVLDKLAGDQVDLFVNGKCIAKGDVVVVDDNFGVRITEILKDHAFLSSKKG